MSIVQLIPLLLNLSMGIIVLALALNASFAEAAYLLRRPALLLRSVVSMNLVMPALVVVVALLLNLDPAIKIAIGALALSPVPPILPGKQEKAFGNPAYVISLLVVMAALSIVIVPLGVWIIGALAGIDGLVGMRTVAPAVLITIIVPLLIGLAVHHYAPDLARRLARPASILGAVLLVIAFIPIVIAQWGQIVGAIGNGTLLTLAIFSLAGLAIGHWLGGPEADNRTVLALATSTRHPGVALAVAGALFPEQAGVTAVVFIHLVVAAIVTAPYVRWRQQTHDGHTTIRHAARP